MSYASTLKDLKNWINPEELSVTVQAIWETHSKELFVVMGDIEKKNRYTSIETLNLPIQSRVQYRNQNIGFFKNNGICKKNTWYDEGTLPICDVPRKKGFRLQSRIFQEKLWKSRLTTKSLLNAQLLGSIVKKSIHGRILLISQSKKASLKLL